MNGHKFFELEAWSRKCEMIPKSHHWSQQNHKHEEQHQQLRDAAEENEASSQVLLQHKSDWKAEKFCLWEAHICKVQAFLAQSIWASHLVSV